MKSNESQNRRIEENGELGLIRQIRARTVQFAGGSLRLGIGDDCALLRPKPSEELAITTDLSISGRHFRLNWHPPRAVGHRTLARGLSDLAAMGARPMAAFLSLGLPRELVEASSGRNTPQSLPGTQRLAPSFTSRFTFGSERPLRNEQAPRIGRFPRSERASWIERFLDGFFALAEAHKTPLAGGDLAESPLAVADIVLIGAVPRGKALLRSGARAGDFLYVTGSLGGASAGLARLAEFAGVQRKPHAGELRIPKRLEAALAPHLYPQPRIAQGLWLSRHGLASAALDVSDGLSVDLKHLCDESGVSAEIDAAALPLHPTATLVQALHGGEDYELLFTAQPDARMPRAIAGVPVTRIGQMVRCRTGRPQMVLITEHGSQPLNPQGWEHFAQ